MKRSFSKSCGFLTLAFFLSILFFSCGALAQTVKDSLSSIAAALQDKRFEKAIELLRPAIQHSPTNAQLWTMQGVAFSGEGREKDALASFRAALKILPDYLPALKNAGQLEFDKGSSAGVPFLQHVLRLIPGDRTTLGMLAVLEYQHGDCAAAAAYFGKAEPLFDSQPTALHAYATCLVKLKQFDRAAKVFQQTVALNSDDPRERYLLAAVQLMAQQPESAISSLEPLLHANPPEAETLELAAAAYEEDKKTPDAVNVLREAISLDPRNTNLYLDFASICYTHGSYQVGVDAINDGLALQPKAAPLYFSRGVLYVQLAQYDKAEADFQKAYELDPNQSLSSAAQGLAAAQENDLGRALAKVQTSLARKPDDAFLLYLQADILAEENADPGTPEFRLALTSAKRAVALQPTLAPARGVLAKLDLQSGQYKEAVEQCRKALESDPTDQTVVYHLIQALRKTGDQGEIPDLLKRLASLREQASKKERDRNRYKLVEDAPQPSSAP